MKDFRMVEDDNGDRHRVANPEAEDRGYDEARQIALDHTEYAEGVRLSPKQLEQLRVGILAIAPTRDELVNRIAAASARLGDLKAVHSRYYDGEDRRPLSDVISEMESIAYSAMMYLEGVPGAYSGGLDTCAGPAKTG
jgi:hypothetical protein